MKGYTRGICISFDHQVESNQRYGIVCSPSDPNTGLRGFNDYFNNCVEIHSAEQTLNMMQASKQVSDELVLKNVPDESSVNYIPKRYIKALQTPYAESWKRQATTEVLRLVKNDFMKIVYDQNDIPESCRKDKPIRTQIVCTIQTKPGCAEYPKDEELLDPESWKPNTPYMVRKARFTPMSLSLIHI